MVSKKILLSLIDDLEFHVNDLMDTVAELSTEVNNLQKKVKKIESNQCSCKLDRAVMSCKKEKADKYSRDKSGKFTKRK